MEDTEGRWRPGLMWRTVASPVIGVGWLVGVLVWWAFLSEGFSVAQKFAIVILSLLVLGALMGAVWLPWTMRFAPDRDRKIWGQPGFTPRVAGSTVVIAVTLLALVYWLYFPGEDYNVCQSLVVIIVVILVMGGILAPIWIWWSGRRARHAVVEGVAREVEVHVEAERAVEAGPGPEEEER